MKMRPTERQVAELREMDDDALLDKALASMHALNRRAKEKRDRRRRYRQATFSSAVGDEIDAIYELKDRFLMVLVAAGHATVERFELKTRRGEMVCRTCGRSWSALSGDWCHECESESGEAEEFEEVTEWYVVCCRDGIRFHQPGESASAEIRAAARPTDAHDPNQPQREIPNVGLTIEAQHRCVELAIERLMADVAAVAAQRSPSAGDVCVEARQ
jgi:hypothetical protein